MSSVLVTGSEGFLGRHLVARLLEAGWRVHGLDRVETSPNSGQYEVHAIDVLDAEQVSDVVRGVAPDAVVHLAALTAHEEMVERRTETLRINMQGTMSILAACQQSGVGKLVYASTGKVYGKIEELPIRETHPLNPLNVLGKSKLIVEKVIDFYSLDSRTQMVILRIFNVYGPGQRHHFLVPTILSQLADGSTTVTLGNTRDRRDYIHVHDVVGAMLAMLTQSLDQRVEIFNVGAGVAHSAGDVARMIGEALDREIMVSVDRSRFRHDESPVEYADIGKLISLGWGPEYSLKDGLEMTALHYMGGTCK